ncbi:hypothetical protein RDABS01_039838 [Bienertia sinuspersici]
MQMGALVSPNLVSGHTLFPVPKTTTPINIFNPSFSSFSCPRTYTFNTPPSPFQLTSNRQKLPPIACQPNNDSNNNSNSEKEEKPPISVDSFPNKQVNKRIAVLSSVAAFGLFLSSRLDFGVSLTDLTALALPYDQALSNGKPTVVEFYADWCEVCRELAPEVYKVEQQYRDSVNFVMLNVDNTKWEQEIDEFGVEGIPHFAFLDKDGNEQGNVVGRLPTEYFLDNVDALARGKDSIPHARVVGQYSILRLDEFIQVADPRSHG